MTAALFFDRQPKALQGEALTLTLTLTLTLPLTLTKALQGEMLVLCNSLVALVMLIVAVRGLGVLGGELRDLQLTFADDGSAVQLPPLRTLTLTPTLTLSPSLTLTLTLTLTPCGRALAARRGRLW